MYSQNNELINQLKIWMLVLLGMIILIIIIGGLTRLTDSGLSITSWELFVGTIPPLSNEKWVNYFNLYKTIPEFKEQNFNMSLSEFKIIFWWEWVHRQLGRIIGLAVMLPMIYFKQIRLLVITLRGMVLAKILECMTNLRMTNCHL